MLRLERGRAVEIGDRPGDLENAVIGALGTRDALPADNDAIAPPTKVNR